MQNVTLRTFIDDMLNLCNMENNSENVKKFRVKFTRELKKMGIWETAPEIIQGKNSTKVFSQQQLDLLKANLFNYLAKQSRLNVKKLTKIAQETIEFNEQQKELLPEQLEELYNKTNNPYSMPVTPAEEKDIMLRALFELFFTPIDTTQWQKDRELEAIISDSEDEQQIMTIEYTTAVDRLNSHNKSAYYKKR